MLIPASGCRADVFLVTYLDVLQLERFDVLKQGENVGRVVFYVDGKGRLGADEPCELHEFRYREAVRGVSVPMPIIGLTLQTTARHVLRHVFRSIYHRAAIAEEGEVLLTESFCQVRAERIGVGAEQHLVDPDAAGLPSFGEVGGGRQHEASLRVTLVGCQLDVESLPVLRDAAYLLPCILLAPI